ncbi:porin [Myxococcota bacterium]|nr:porin [Myxococcota bacterium]
MAAAVVIGPQLAAANDAVQEQLREMQARMGQLEDHLQAAQDELTVAQGNVQDNQRVIERSGLDEERSGLSALSSFLDDTEFGGVAAASYNINFRNPQQNVPPGPYGAPGRNTGTIGAMPFHPLSSNFQVDQLHFSMANAATPDSRGGFGVDMIYGMTADPTGGSDTPAIIQAYASYLAPFAGGIEVKGGRWNTVIGAEVIYVGQNYNITRGLVWGIQPVSHNGLMLSGGLGESLSWSASVASSYSVNVGSTGNLDNNNAKNGIFALGWEGGTLGLNAAYMYATDCNNGGTGATVIVGGTCGDDTSHLVDVVATWNPSDDLGAWVNFDYLKRETAAGAEATTKGLALASRLAVNDTTGVAIRFEVLMTEAMSTVGATTSDTTNYALTWTVDHALTDHLTARVELRWDKCSNDAPSNDNCFTDGDGSINEGSQLVGLGQLVYAF